MSKIPSSPSRGHVSRQVRARDEFTSSFNNELRRILNRTRYFEDYATHSPDDEPQAFITRNFINKAPKKREVQAEDQTPAQQPEKTEGPIGNFE